MELVIILYNDGNVLVNEGTYEDCIKKFEQLCVAGGNTKFAEPLSHILKLIEMRKIKELQVIFMTDGEDNGKDDTKKVSDILKRQL